MFALGLMSWLYHRPKSGTPSDFISRKFKAKPEIAEANTKAFKAGWAYGETSEDFRVTYEVAPGRPPAGHLPQHPRQPGADAWPDRGIGEERSPALPRRLPDHAGLGDPRGALASEGFRRPDVSGRRRDRRRRRRARRELRRRPRRLHVERSRRRPEDGDDRPGRHARAAPCDHRRPARRAVHGDADEARAGRPAAIDVGPERRVAGAGDRRLDTGGCFDAAIEAARSRSSTGRRSSCSRTPTSRTARSRPIPTSRRTRRSRWISPMRPTTRAASCRISGMPRRLRGRGRLRHARPRASDRGAREGRSTATSRTTPTTTTTCRRIRARKVAGIAADIPELTVDEEGGEELLVLSWGGTPGRWPLGCAAYAAGAALSRTRTWSYLNPFPATPAMCCADTRRFWFRNESWTAPRCVAEFLVDAVGYNRVRGLPFRSSELAEAMEGML